MLPIIMFITVCFALMIGYPVAFTLAGTALLFSGIGIMTGVLNADFLVNYPERVFGIMTNNTLIAVPLFVFMGVMLERSKIAEELLENMSHACGKLPAGLAISVVLVGALMAASTGIVGATVVTMGLMSLPTMLKRGYSPEVATGTICATGTLGQIIPPSIALVLLGDIISSAYQQVQLEKGIFNAAPVSVGDLFVGAIVPGLLLVVSYVIYLLVVGIINPDAAPANKEEKGISGSVLLKSVLPPILLIFCVLGSIVSGTATPSEAAGLGAIAATFLAFIKKQFSLEMLKGVVESTTKVTAMVFAILLGASLFSLTFNGLGGETIIPRIFPTLTRWNINSDFCCHVHYIYFGIHS